MEFFCAAEVPAPKGYIGGPALKYFGMIHRVGRIREQTLLWTAFYNLVEVADAKHGYERAFEVADIFLVLAVQFKKGRYCIGNMLIVEER